MFKRHHVSRKNIIGRFMREISEQNCFISNILLLLFSVFCFCFCLFCVFGSVVCSVVVVFSYFFFLYFLFLFLLFFPFKKISWLLSVFVSPKALAFYYLV